MKLETKTRPVIIVTDLGDQKVISERFSGSDLTREGGVDHGGGEGREAEGAVGHWSPPALWALG